MAGPIYEENSNVARFVLTALSEDAMTKETRTDLWAQENRHYVWTIEHVLPQGPNVPDAGSRCSAVPMLQHRPKRWTSTRSAT